ncbi:unnamed protein product [Ilex paraguariensis]|uniref:chalcone synthase n=1 Tax=Ilex paraguariensis TaxID=185542 RepID=A0ABC8SFB1_9AQUA
MVRQRYMHLTEEILKENPVFCEHMAPSLGARQDMLVVEVPKLGKEAAQKAIKEWDYHLTKLLGLSPSVKRFMMYQQGCFANGTVLCLAKDLAKNNRYARVLVTNLDSLVAQALFGDGAAAIMIGSDPVIRVEKPLFELISAIQTILPMVQLRDISEKLGSHSTLMKDVPVLISKNIEKSLRHSVP